MRNLWPSCCHRGGAAAHGSSLARARRWAVGVDIAARGPPAPGVPKPCDTVAQSHRIVVKPRLRFPAIFGNSLQTPVPGPTPLWCTFHSDIITRGHKEYFWWWRLKQSGQWAGLSPVWIYLYCGVVLCLSRDTHHAEKRRHNNSCDQVD